MNKYNNILLGADIEMFLKIRGTDEYVPSIDFVPGSKEEPFELTPGYGIQPDNVSVEFTMPPAKDSSSFVSNVLTAKALVESYLPGFLEVSFLFVLFFLRGSKAICAGPFFIRSERWNDVVTSTRYLMNK